MMDANHYRRPAHALEELPLFASEKPAAVEAPPADAAPWYEGAIAALDFETTGVDPFTCRPVSVAFYCDDPEGEHALFQYSEIVDCGVEVPETTSAIHGITTARVRAEGRPIAGALMAVRSRLVDCAASGVPLVIMNVRYDWSLLRAELERHGMRIPEGVQLVDPIIIDQKFDKYRKGKRRLADLCRTYGLPPLDDAHDAMADARAAIAVTREMARKYLSTVPLRDLAMLQAEWFETFRVSRNSWWKSQGDERFMEPGWPLLDRSEP
jgi:DNA polymerase-3 subunit epsilon